MSIRVIPGRGPKTKTADDVLPGLVVLEAGVGYRGANRARDVMAVQESLNEVAAEAGGSLLAVDGRCGDKTIAAILRFQTRWVDFRDSRIDPGGKTLTALNAAGGVRTMGAVTAKSSGFAAKADPGAELLHKQTKLERQLAAVLRHKLVIGVLAPRAYRYCLATLGMLPAMHRHARRLPPTVLPPTMPAPFSRDDPDRLHFLVAAKHFKLREERPAEAIAALRKIEETVRLMTLTLMQRAGQAAGISPMGTRLYVCNLYQPAEPKLLKAVGYTTLGAAWKTGGTIHFPPNFDNDSMLEQQDTVLHEIAHAAGPQGNGRIDDLGYADEDQYLNNTTSQRLRNATTYALFVHECGAGTHDAIYGSYSGGYRLRIMQPQVAPGGAITLEPAPSSNDHYAYPSGYVDYKSW